MYNNQEKFISPDKVEVDSPNQSNNLLKEMDIILEDLRKKTNPTDENPFTFMSEMIPKYQTFYDKYPRLFEMMCKNPYIFERDRIIQMLQTRDKIYRKEISYDQASKNVGKQYYEEFVKPTLPKHLQPSEEEMEKVMNIKDSEEQRKYITRLLHATNENGNIQIIENNKKKNNK